MRVNHGAITKLSVYIYLIRIIDSTHTIHFFLLSMTRFDCIGYDNCWIFSDPNPDEYQATVYAPGTGIQLAIKTDQVALQFYSCHGLDGTLPIKKKEHHKHHGHHDRRCENNDDDKQEYVQKYGCLVLETENYIDGINNPECKF